MQYHYSFIDRDDAPIEIAAAEVFEETGYKINSSGSFHDK